MDSSTAKLSELLRHPDDLDKIQALKLEYTRKKAAVDSQLRSGLQEQLLTTRAGIDGITAGQQAVQNIKDEMMKIDKLCAEAQNMIRDFPNINLVSQTHRNFSAVETMRRDLESFNDRIDQVESMLREDDQDRDMPNLLATHYELTKLRNIRDDAMEQIVRANDPGAQATLEDYFSRLDDTIVWFDEHIGDIALAIIDIAGSGERDEIIVRFAVIIEAEEKSDKRVVALQEALKDHKEMAARFQSITDGAKQTRRYKDNFLLAIKAHAEGEMAKTRYEFLQNPGKLGNYLKWFFTGLQTAKMGLTRLMPKKWKIAKVYAKIYHQLMHDFLIELVDNEETNSAILLLVLAWPESYYKRMAKLGFAQEELTPHVLDNREAELVRGFRERVIQYLDQWIDRIFATEKKDFAERTVDGSNLDTDEYGYFRTRNMVDLWRMLREQVDVAGNSQRQDVTEGVIDTMLQRLGTRQQTWQKMLDDEVEMYISTNSEADGLSALQDWLVGTANDQIACIDDNEDEGRFAYLSSFSQKFEPLVSPQFAQRVDADITNLRNGYVDLSTHCLTQFARLVIAVDFKAVLPDLFTPAWYSSQAMSRMVVTIEEYISDYKTVLHHSLLDTFIEALSDELLVRYLSSVRNKGAKFKRQDPLKEKIYQDISLIIKFFQESQILSPDVRGLLIDKWKVLQLFEDLIIVDKASLPDVYERGKQLYWDLQLSWVEAVLRSRDDSDRALLSAVKTRAAAVSVPRGIETIMGQVK